MEGITQTILEGEQEGVYGNCLQAAVATCLDLPLYAVPHFAMFLWWDTALKLWAAGRYLGIQEIKVTEIPQERCVLNGISPRGVAHSVVAEHGEIIWDPHPSRDGLTSLLSAFVFGPFVYLNKCLACNRSTG